MDEVLFATNAQAATPYQPDRVALSLMDAALLTSHCPNPMLVSARTLMPNLRLQGWASAGLLAFDLG